MFKNNFPSYTTTADGTRLFYTTNFDPKHEPRKDLIVFNYGLVCNNAHFEKQIPYFDERNFDILIHNYRGHFNSSGADSIKNITFKNMVLDLNHLLTTINRTDATMIGHSMGVNVSLEFALVFPEKVKRLILISGSILPPQNVMFDTNLMQLVFPYVESISNRFPNLYEKFWSSSYMIPLIRKIIHRGGFNTDKVSEEFIQTYLKRIGELGPQLFNQLFKEMEKHDIINHLEEIRQPTLIIGGDKDKVIPNHLQEVLATHLPNAKFYIVKDGSHVPQRDFPETINEKISYFIRENP